ncbi:MAG: FkbM family methyltransferase [Bacteroidota bacterium]
MLALRQWLGLLRSRLMYYGKPFNRRRLRRFYQAFVPEGGLCFDIGAHLGNRSDAFLQLGATVVAVEPQPVCVNYLRRRFGSHPQFHLLPRAVGAQPGLATLHVSSLTPTISTLAGQHFQQAIQADTSFQVDWDQQVEVPVVTLDQMIGEFGVPDFCKIDVEDFEVEVLAGLTQALPSLSLEYFAYLSDRALLCVEKLARLGEYKYQISHGESQRLLFAQWVDQPEIEAFLQALKPSDRSGDIYARLTG